jgi:hypothetical protein
MLKTKQRDLKAIIKSDKETIAMKCAECMGFFVDGYNKCTSTTCPLIKFFPTSSHISQGGFVEKMKTKARELGNDEKAFVCRISGRFNLVSEKSKTAGKALNDKR